MRRFKVAGPVVALSLIGASAFAQDWQSVGLRTAPSGASYQGGFAISGSNGVWRHDIYAVLVPIPGNPDGLSTARYLIRKSLNNPDGLEQTSWADERTCPQVLGVLRALDEFQSPDIVLPGLRRVIPLAGGSVMPPMGPIHGRGYTIWGSARTGDGAHVYVTMSGGAGLIAAFGEFAETRLEACWTPDPPPT